MSSLEILKNGKFTTSKGIIINQGNTIDKLDELFEKSNKIPNK
jgi:hypothetical protein